MSEQAERSTPPSCVGIIMDGNRRWAKARGISKLEGHRAGTKNLKEVLQVARTRGIKHLIVYAFSTENWNREPAEVSYLLELFRESIEKEMTELAEDGVCIRFVGQRDRFSDRLQRSMRELESSSEANADVTLWICLSYGGRAEIVEAARQAAVAGAITEESLAQKLWTADMPEPDIIIRTGGEKRLSNFLPWQSVYSELFFTDRFWPDFDEREFDSILAEFAQRERRRGK